MRYAFVLPSDVELSILEHARYIARRNPVNAGRWVEDVMEAMQGVVALPTAYPVDAFLTGRLGVTVRKISIGNYLAFYVVDDDARTVTMVRFRHGARLE